LRPRFIGFPRNKAPIGQAKSSGTGAPGNEAKTERNLAVKGERLRFRKAKGRRPRLPIDYFFRCLAEDQQAFAVGIVLSGNGSDGAVGVGTIKEQMGLVMAQDPQSAIYPGMPARAIATRLVDYVLPASKSGHGYVTKQAKGEAIVEAIRRILSGQVYVSRDLSQQILETFANNNPAAGICRVGQLTDREFEVFQLAGQGLSSAQIARLLQLSIKTVQAHRANIKVKLQIKTTPELISYAASWLAHQAVQSPA
jgi:DNA-binding CsgD family transcriptional regulator